MPYLVTLRLDPLTFTTLNTLRRAHFPASRNVVPAHLTLFHALPDGEEQAIRHTLNSHAQITAPLNISCPAVRFLGRGVALEIHAPQLCNLRAQLAATWRNWLSAQDRQTYRPHVTIQNKVTSQAARSLFDQLEPAWRPFSGVGEGLLLWRYLQGPWELIANFPLIVRKDMSTGQDKITPR